MRSQKLATGPAETSRAIAASDESSVASGRQAALACDTRPMMEPERQAEVLLRLSKAAGQVQGVARMVQADRYCVDVLNQIAAAQKALDGVARIVTRNYLERCVTDAITGGDPLIYDEVMRVLDRRR